MLAHQGEELLIPAMIVAAVLLVPMIKHRLRGSADSMPDRKPGSCAYCGATLDGTDERCSACGFRIRR